MKHQLMIIMFAAIFLQACSTTPQSICTEQNRQEIVDENDRLVKAKIKMDAYIATRFPGTMSMLTHNDLSAAHQRSYNISFDALVLRAAKFNQTCSAG